MPSPGDIDRERWPIEHEDCFVGKLEVLSSGAGSYIGRRCLDKQGGFIEPYSRESGYFPNCVKAKEALDRMNFEVRDCVENNAAYEAGGLPRPKAD